MRDKRAQLDAQLKALEAREKQAERKADTRRKVIAGALALEHFEKNRDSEFGRLLYRLLDEYVVRPHDRALFECLTVPLPPDPVVEFEMAGRETAAGTSPAP
ncbi:MAG: mobilization protein [Alphaproteobacteria bacterium]|nr:mobilization protein [Alphaproteobacteria bacterium]